jgi:transcriptional regulator with XRE-family HTH domain
MSGVDDAPADVDDPGSERRVGDLVRTFRNERRLSLRTLAARAGFSPSFISQVEHGQASPSIASLERIARALGVGLGDFFPRSPDAAASVVRARERAELTSSWSRARIEALGPTGVGHGLEPMMLTLAPGGRSGPHPHVHGGAGFAIVFDGEVLLTLGDTVHRLARGDAASFAATTAHHWENVGRDPARIVVVTSRPVR